MKFKDISEGVAGPQKCWPGHRKIGTQPGTGKNAGKRVNKCKKIGEDSALRQAVKEFAPSFGGDDGNDGFSKETLKRLAAQWWQGDEDPRIERTLMAAGWEIGQDEGYDEGGVFVVQSGDVNGKSYISWSAKDLEGMAEGIGDEVNPADVGEYDREGNMAIGQLKTAEDAAAELRSILDADENLPEWVQAKITKAVDYLDTARDYMKSKEQGVAEGEVTKTKTGIQHRSTDKYGGGEDEDGRRKDARDLIHLNKDLTARLDRSMGIKHAHGNKKSTNEANYYNPLDQDRREQDAMDASKKAFKRQELDFEYQRERKLAQQRQQADQGPWYLRIDGKVYRQKGQPKEFAHKKAANGYALAIIKNRPELQGKIMLTKSDQDQ